MRAPKLIAIACACTLALGGTATPAAEQAAHAAAVASEPRPASVGATGAETGDAVGVGESRADAAPAAAAPPQGQGRKKEHILVRIIAAPFRGLARLFGGKNDRAKAARVSVEPTPRRDPVAAAEFGTKSDQQIATVLPQPAPLPAAPASAPAAPVSPAPPAPAEGEDGEMSYAPAPFIPLIVGVPRDPLSQGRALLENGYLSEAIAELSVAAVTGQNLVEANNLLGLAYDRRGRHGDAREAFERALSFAPNDPHILSNLGYSLYLDDRYQDALVRLKQATRLAPGNPHILNNLALVYGRLHKYGDAFKHFERAGGELHARMQTGALLEAAGLDREAIKHYEAARRIDTTSAEPLRRLIPLYNRTGQRDKAEAVRRDLDRTPTKASSTSG
ncbi:MAG: tetratricopeptide repeat protein [Acidobacteria bacterium]|nr:tetratricopeptide repeat protein [Acidobacteriota bacterium]